MGGVRGWESPIVLDGPDRSVSTSESDPATEYSPRHSDWSFSQASYSARSWAVGTLMLQSPHRMKKGVPKGVDQDPPMTLDFL